MANKKGTLFRGVYLLQVKDVMIQRKLCKASEWSATASHRSAVRHFSFHQSFMVGDMCLSYETVDSASAVVAASCIMHHASCIITNMHTLIDRENISTFIAIKRFNGGGQACPSPPREAPLRALETRISRVNLPMTARNRIRDVIGAPPRVEAVELCRVVSIIAAHSRWAESGSCIT